MRNIVWHYRPLFFSTSQETVEPIDYHFELFLSDRHCANDFHVPANALDIMYLRILSRPPPSDASQTFSREDLIAVLHTAVDSMCIPTERSQLTAVGFATIQKVAFRSQSRVFYQSSNSGLSLFDRSLATLLLDPHRSGPFCHPRWEERQLHPPPQVEPPPKFSFAFRRQVT